MSTEPPWDELDPGIIDLVRLLWLAGFYPTDSGTLDVPHVFCRADSVDVVGQVAHLDRVLYRNGIKANVQGSVGASGVVILEVYPDP